jgi:tetratricopeptide (TPR) repeat protein
VAFSPSGKRLASGSEDGTVKIWDGSTGKQVISLEGHDGPVMSVTFSHDGRRIASGSGDSTIKTWDSATGKELVRPLKGHVGTVWSVAFSPDDQRLASVSFGMKISDSATGKELFSVKDPAQIWSVAFSPDGQRLALGSREGSVRLYEASIPSEVQDLRAAYQLVTDLFHVKGLRADVLEWLRTVPGMIPSRRQEALAAAQTYPESSSALNELARQLVMLPDRELSSYRKALRYSEEACQLAPKNGLYLNTLGVAHYRVGNYDKALETLRSSDRINNSLRQGSTPADLAFLAMTQHHLGHDQEAQALLQRLRERMKASPLLPAEIFKPVTMFHQVRERMKVPRFVSPDFFVPVTMLQRLGERVTVPRGAQNAEAQGFLREAEALLAKAKAPGGK